MHGLYLRAIRQDLDMAEKSDWEHNIMPGNLPGAEFLEKKKEIDYRDL